MATDKSPPRTGLILKGSVLAIATLIATHSALVAYFDHYAQAEEQRKFGDIQPEALMSVREADRERLHSGRVPIDKAMQQMAAGGRTANPDIAPKESAPDLAPLAGWVKMPSEVPPAMTAVQAPPASSEETARDAGAAPAPNAPPKGKSDRAHPDRGPTPGKPPTKNP